MINRVILVVADSLGVGEAPDAYQYGDEGANTLLHVVQNASKCELPNLTALGLYNTCEALNNVDTISSYGKAQEVSEGKDTTSGHWEIMGVPVSVPFKTFPSGFPREIIEKFESSIGKKVLANLPLSGLDAINQFGEEHVETGNPIVYTSADSVFQIACHEYVIPIEELYHMCRVARKLLVDDYSVARVIARPFLGIPGNFRRTSNRKDFSVKPFSKTVLNYIVEDGLSVNAIGKISDIYAREGITSSVSTISNAEGIEKTISAIREETSGLIFTNLVDFDMLFGHRRDVEGYANALMELDKSIPEILSSLNDNDVFILTADHGNDPTAKGFDHTREVVPILIYGKSIRQNFNFGTRITFADIGATIAEMLKVQMPDFGTSFFNEIKSNVNE